MIGVLLETLGRLASGSRTHAMTDRYQVTGAEGEFEPGSNEQVLRNRVGIQSPDDMADLELGLLAQLYDEVLFDRFPDRRAGTTSGWAMCTAGRVRNVRSTWSRADSCSLRQDRSPGCSMNSRSGT